MGALAVAGLPVLVRIHGGGFYADSSHVLMFGTTVSGNDANGSGGGYYVYSCLFFCGGAQPPPYSHLSMVNSTVSGNSAVGGTGGWLLSAPGTPSADGEVLAVSLVC